MELIRVTYERKSVLRNLLELYQYDTSPYEQESDSDVNDYGLFDYKYLDHYWTEEGRHPFFVMVSGKLGGFVLVRELDNSDEGMPKFSMAEFFIMKKYRRLGIGYKAAFTMFEMFKGRWSISWLETNSTAQIFWTSTITKYSDGKFSHTIYGGKPALEFHS